MFSKKTFNLIRFIYCVDHGRSLETEPTHVLFQRQVAYKTTGASPYIYGNSFDHSSFFKRYQPRLMNLSLCCRNLVKKCYNTFTFSHFADAFLQSDLQLGNT